MKELLEQLTTLTPNQKYLFDGVLDVYKNTTLSQQIKLAKYISKDDYVDSRIRSIYSGELVEDQRIKNYYWFMENQNLLDEILEK